MGRAELPLYERLAGELAEAIAHGRWGAGERLPSVRQACATWQVSPATVFKVYEQLEDRGLLETRPRSGHYVRAPRRTRPAPLPQATPSADTARPVEIGELVLELLGSTRDHEVVPLGSAFPAPGLFPFDALARAGARAMRRLSAPQVTGALTRGDEALRGQLLQRHHRHGVPLHPEELVITNGALEALNLALEAVSQPGDVVLVESPAFYGALQAIERLRLRAMAVATHPAEGVDLAALEQQLQRERVAACWFMPQFQNPLGASMPPDRKRALVALLARHGVPLIEDDVYGELYEGPRRPAPAKAHDRAGLVLHCSSFSKCLAPGYRVGWVAAGRYAPQVERLKMASSLSTSLPAQRAIAEYLAQGGYDRHLRGLRAALGRQRQWAERQILRSFPPGTRVTRPEGGYFVWVELPPSVDSLALHRQALAQGISTAPGLLFSADGRFRHHLRVNVGHGQDARIAAAIQHLGRLAGGAA